LGADLRLAVCLSG